MGSGKPLTSAKSDRKLIKPSFKETEGTWRVWREERVEAVRPKDQSVSHGVK